MPSPRLPLSQLKAYGIRRLFCIYFLEYGEKSITQSRRQNCPVNILSFSFLSTELQNFGDETGRANFAYAHMEWFFLYPGQLLSVTSAKRHQNGKGDGEKNAKYLPLRNPSFLTESARNKLVIIPTRRHTCTLLKKPPPQTHSRFHLLRGKGRRKRGGGHFFRLQRREGGSPNISRFPA